jgi:ABC-2 type transport system permease protein
VLFFSFSLSWMWIVLGLLMRTPNAVLTTGFLILFPLAFASNIYVDPETTPSWLHAFIDVNPVSLLVTAVRGLMSGNATVGQVALVLGISAAHIAIAAPLAMILYRNKQ